MRVQFELWDKGYKMVECGIFNNDSAKEMARSYRDSGYFARVVKNQDEFTIFAKKK